MIGIIDRFGRMQISSPDVHHSHANKRSNFFVDKVFILSHSTTVHLCNYEPSTGPSYAISVDKMKDYSCEQPARISKRSRISILASQIG